MPKLSKIHAKIHPKSAFFAAGSASEEFLDAGRFKDAQKWCAEVVFRSLLATLRRLWAPCWAQLGPEGEPKVDHVGTKSPTNLKRGGERGPQKKT